MILKQDGSVWSTLIPLKGVDSKGASKHFEPAILNGAVTASGGNGFSIVLKQGGSVWGAGRNNVGQLGDGTRNRKLSFHFVQMVPGAHAVAAGGYHTMVLTPEGHIWATGHMPGPCAMGYRP